MQDIIGSYIERFLKNHQKHKKFLSIFLVLSIIVVCGVVWRMKLTGISMNADVMCGKEEHQHGESCYEEILICGLEETEETEQPEVPAKPEQTKPSVPAHTHTEECYEEQEISVCGQEEHQHGEECFNEEGILICETAEHQHTEECCVTEKVLICELEESTEAAEESAGASEIAEEVTAAEPEVEKTKSHVHTEACYEKRLVCEKEEHLHTVMCMCDTGADLESAADWEATLPELKHVWADDLVSVAYSQLGYEESSRNFVLDEDGESTRGYTRYGQWYGNAYGDWCAMFVSWCLNYSEIPKQAVPYASGCYAWTVELEELGLYERTEEYLPSAGDIIFFDNKGTGKSNHVGIVTKIEKEADKTVKIHTIEGNSSEKVCERTYQLPDEKIVGYANLTKAKERYDLLTGIADAEKTERVVFKTLNAVIYTDETYSVRAEDEETAIVVTGTLPEGAEVKAYPVSVNLENCVVIASYDITIFLADGTVYEPKEGESLKVEFLLPKQEAAEPETEEEAETEEEELVIYYVPEKPEEPEKLETTVNEQSVSFTAEHFSVYALARAVTGPTITVNSAAELKSAFSNNDNVTVQLTGDFSVSGTIELNDKKIDLDLNGHKLTVTGTASLFDVPAGSELTMKDSQAATAAESEPGGALYGNVAGYTEDSNLTYYVTKSAVANAATGATAETLVKYEVALRGRISAGSATVANISGGTLNLESGMVYNGTERAFDISDGVLNLSGGYVFGFKRTGALNTGDTNFGGAILAAGGTTTISGTVLAANDALNGGAIYAKNAVVNISGGIISGNQSTRKANGWGDHSEGGGYRCGGGGIYAVGNASITMSSGYITNNVAEDDGYFDGGGGVCLSGNAGMVLNNGYITGNQAQGGGGVRTDFGKSASFTMNGGFVSANTATTAEGGGVTIDRGGVGTFNGGHITNNRIINTVHWGGGGLFCADGSDLFLKQALITENDAGGFGGGVAGCPTGKIYLYVDDGCAIYHNSDIVNGEIHFVNGGSKDGIDAERCDAFFQSQGHKDYFCALNSTVTGTMLGDHAANWTGSADGTAVSLGADDAQTATSVMGLESHPSAEGIDAAQAAASVYINGNYSYTHGGGILCNGNLIIGNPTNIEIPARLGLKATKVFFNAEGAEVPDISEYQFKFQILDSNQQVIGEAVAQADGTINFENLAFEQEGTYVYTIREVRDDSKPSINFDTAEYLLTVTVKEKVTTLYEATKMAYLITNTKVEKSDGNGGWTEVSNTAYGDGKDNLALGLTAPPSFTNTTVTVSKITVIKEWDGDIPGADFVTVDLYQDGVVYDTIELSAANHWTHTWTDLPAGHSYHVEERELRGYIASYTTADSPGAQSDYWVPASSLTAGGQYLIVSGDGSKALYVSPNHQNAGFDGTDTKGVTQRTGTLTVGGTGYSTWYETDGIDPRCIFTAQERTQNNNTGIILKNNGASANTWLLIQNAGGNYLKSTSGNNYASFMVFENGMLKGQDGYNWNPNNLRTVIYSNDKFNTSTNTNNAARLYTLVSGSRSDGSIITITNTPKEDEEYVLPETGGMGTLPYTLIGLLLAAVSIINLKKEKRR